MRPLLLLVPLLALTSCDDPEGQVTLVSKTRYAVSFHHMVNTPVNQPNLYLTDLHDADTGVDYLIVQDGDHGLAIIQLPPKKAEKATQASSSAAPTAP